MSDEATQDETKSKRRGRPVGKAKRHDPDEAPASGNRGLDIVNGKEPGFRYFLASDEDIPEIQYRGGVICTRDNESARPFFDDRRAAGESEIRVKNLTLMKMSEEDARKHESFGTNEAKRRLNALKRSATSQIGGGQYASISNHEGGMSRQAI